MTCCVPIFLARSRPDLIQRRMVSGSLPARFAASGTVIIARYYYIYTRRQAPTTANPIERAAKASLAS